MAKELKDMTLEELWKLFPIVLKDHSLLWREWAKGEIAYLSVLLGDYDAIISHIGSTAIPNIMAKPIVDILVEIPENKDMRALRELMETNGYLCMSVSDKRMSFNKGYTPNGYAKKVFHVHVHRKGDNDEVYFRDYLISHPEAAKEYESLKISLVPKYEHNRDAYTAAKTSFVERITRLARSQSR